MNLGDKIFPHYSESSWTLPNQGPTDDLTETSKNGKRWYRGNSFAYPSITTVLSSLEDGIGLKKWKEIVGEQKAKSIAAVTANRGEALHKLCEMYLNNLLPFVPNNTMPDTKGQFRLIKPYLDKIDTVACMEQPMYSKKFMIAGRTDLIAVYEGDWAVIDFKTNKTDIVDTPDKLPKYFIQENGYKQMFKEHTGIDIKKGVLLFTSNDHGAHEIVDDLDKYTGKLKSAIFDFYSNIQKEKAHA